MAISKVWPARNRVSAIRDARGRMRLPFRCRNEALSIVLLSAFVLSACGKTEAKKEEKQAPQVGYIVLNPTTAALTTQLAGRITAEQTSDVRPQVSGLIRRRFFTEGSNVSQGQTLYEIDPRIHLATVNEARADLNRARANLEAATALSDRYRPLAEKNAISKQEYTDAQSQTDQANAQVEQAKARLQTAEVNLQFTRVPAPISGRIGRSLFTQGALVTSGQVQPLAVIQHLDTVFVDLQQSSADLLALRRSLSAGGLVPGSATVSVVLEDGSKYAHPGDVQFSEVVVNPATGAVTLRAKVPNPEGLLMPGMFVRAVFTTGETANAYRVPQPAVRRNAKGEATVFVVDQENKAVQRKIAALAAQDDVWIVTDGLSPGDKVILQGLDKVQPNKPVNPVPAETSQEIKPGKDKSGAKTAKEK